MLDKKLAYFVVTRINYVLFFVRLLCNHKQDLLEAQTCVSRTPASNFDVWPAALLHDREPRDQVPGE